MKDGSMTFLAYETLRLKLITLFHFILFQNGIWVHEVRPITF